ncbi:MAG: DUF6416 domain-containing protein [Pseudonocardiaceae bacterium]
MITLGLQPGIRIEVTNAGTRLEVTEAAATSLLEQLNRALNETATAHDIAVAQASHVLDDDHPLWDQHTGLDGHRVEPEWAASDLKRAQAFYQRVGGKAKVFLDLLVDYPGRLLTVDELCELSGAVFSGSRSIAGAINGLYRPHQSSGRRYPFYWWAGNPTRYAMKPSVATLFHQARSS